MGGYIVLFYSIFYIFFNWEVFRFHERQSIKLVDDAVTGSTEYSKESLELIKRRVSVEGIFTLFDEASSITHSIEFEHSELKRTLKLNSKKAEMELKKRFSNERED